MGLKDEIQGFVVAHDPPDYVSALRFAMNMHHLKDKSITVAPFAPTISGQKRIANRHGHTFDRRTRGRSCHRRRTAEQDKAPCPKCNKVHKGECYALRGCFGCGKPGHRVADYPHRNVLEVNRPAA